MKSKRNMIILILEVIILVIIIILYMNYKKGMVDINTLKVFKESSYYQEKYHDAYKEIKYSDNNQFLEITNQLLDKNYNANEIIFLNILVIIIFKNY